VPEEQTPAGHAAAADGAEYGGKYFDKQVDAGLHAQDDGPNNLLDKWLDNGLDNGLDNTIASVEVPANAHPDFTADSGAVPEGTILVAVIAGMVVAKHLFKKMKEGNDRDD
jgi:hypothetical protein